jgi:integrase
MAQKKTRRGHHEGSVFYVEARQRWVAEVSTSPGKRKRYYFKTKQEAIRKKNEALRELEQGTLAEGPRQKLGDYLEHWLENVHKSKLRVGTYVNYKRLIGYIIADLGKVWLDKLTPQQVQAFYTRELEKGLSSKVVHEIHGVLHLALKNAVRWGMVSRNVCDLVSPPRIVSREVVPLSVDQARGLMKHLRGHRFEVLLTMAVVTGMRRGELLALRWADIDFDRQRLRVLHSVNFLAGYGYVEGKPKTAAGKRGINLPAFLIEMLQQHRAQQAALQETTEYWEDHDLVFPNLSGGYLHPNHLGEAFRKLLQDAGLPPLRFHDLRHSAATILLAQGVNIKVIQELLGHSDIAITLRVYGHLLPSMQGDVVETWEDLFREDGGKGGEESDEECAG